MGAVDVRFHARRAFLLLTPAAVAARVLRGQIGGPALPPNAIPDSPESKDAPPARLPGGKDQRDEILRYEYNRNLKDARDLVDMAKAFEEDLERDDRYVLSLNSLKKLDNMESMIKRIRGRMKRY